MLAIYCGNEIKCVLIININMNVKTASIGYCQTESATVDHFVLFFVSTCYGESIYLIVCECIQWITLHGGTCVC